MVIILSKSGSTAESVYLEEQLAKRNVCLWLLTFDENGILTRRMEKKLIMQLDHEGDKWNLVPNNSTTVYLIVLQALAIRLSELMDISIDVFKANHPGGHIGEILSAGQE